VALGCIVGALAAAWDKRAGAGSAGVHCGQIVRDGGGAVDPGWMPVPEHVRNARDPVVKLTYRRDVLAAAVREWRAAASALGHVATFELDQSHGPLGGGGGFSLDDSSLDDGRQLGPTRPIGSGRPRTEAGARGTGTVSSDGGALALHPEPAMPADLQVDEELRALILKTRSADKGEVMLGLANGVMLCQNPKICWWNGGNILESFLEVTWRQLGVRNLILAVLDDETEEYMRATWPGVPTFRPAAKIPNTQEGTHPANRVSALKYHLLLQFISTGTGVLITDLDLVYVQNPFAHLHRDADVEGQTDGFSEKWSHGQLSGVSDPTMGWGGGGLYAQVFTINVGCLYVRPTARSANLMMRVAARMAGEKGWDQQIFNEEALFPAHGRSTTGLVSIRIMDYLRFVNSKTFFRSERRRFIPGISAVADSLPVMVHMNYHPDKHKRMLCLIARYPKP